MERGKDLHAFADGKLVDVRRQELAERVVDDAASDDPSDDTRVRRRLLADLDVHAREQIVGVGAVHRPREVGREAALLVRECDVLAAARGRASP